MDKVDERKRSFRRTSLVSYGEQGRVQETLSSGPVGKIFIFGTRVAGIVEVSSS